MPDCIKKLYRGIITAKNGSMVPVFADGTPAHSKYNPEREAASFGSAIKSNCMFFIVLGLGGGYHIASLIKRFNAAKIIIIENSIEDINFIRQIPCVAEILRNPGIKILTAEKLKGHLQELYIPSLYGDLEILVQRAWADENKEYAKAVRQLIDREMHTISADYSVQSHFGAIWLRNIMLNLKKASYLQDCQKILSLPTERTAAVIAAGPSLDYSIKEIIRNRGKYYVIATDTAYSVLEKYHVTADAVLSLDGQQVSLYHFTGSMEENTLFIFDLCANPDAVLKAVQKNCRIIFVQSGHPLAAYAGNFMRLEAGAGTVTIAAADFAYKAGFKNIIFFGADFSYHDGKPYTKGTYLDVLYNCKAGRLLTCEQQFCSLMYRTPLIPVNNAKKCHTTEILDSYRKTLEQWQKRTSCIKISYAEQPAFLFRYDFNFSLFRAKLLDDIRLAGDKIDAQNPLLTAVLPYISYLRMKNGREGSVHTIGQLLKLAYRKILRYT